MYSKWNNKRCGWKLRQTTKTQNREIIIMKRHIFTSAPVIGFIIYHHYHYHYDVPKSTIHNQIKMIHFNFRIQRKFHYRHSFGHFIRREKRIGIRVRVCIDKLLLLLFESKGKAIGRCAWIYAFTTKFRLECVMCDVIGNLWVWFSIWFVNIFKWKRKWKTNRSIQTHSKMMSRREQFEI